MEPNGAIELIGCDEDICEADVETKLRTVEDADMLLLGFWRCLLVYLANVGEGDGDGDKEGEDRFVWLGSFSC